MNRRSLHHTGDTQSDTDMSHVTSADYACNVSLIICTRDRADTLHRCLDDLSLADLKDVQGELILVDNGSTDDTLRVMERFAEGTTCPVKIVEEPAPGLSRARNAGLARANGEVVVFTDDDCYLGDNYLSIACEVFDDEQFSYCGGRILLYDSSDAAYGLQEQETFELVPAHSFIPTGRFQGANLVVHRRVFEAIGRFDPQLGAGTRFRCEDIDFVARASQAGFSGAHVPELVVYHHHGRKPGKDIDGLDAANDYARGAYFAKRIKQGHWSYLTGWLREGLFHRKDVRQTVPRFVRELKGAFDYVRSGSEVNTMVEC